MRSDLYVADNYYVIEIDTPGFNKEEIKINYDNGYLNVIAKKEESDASLKREYLRKERLTGEQYRSYYIGSVDNTLIKTNFNNGLLMIKVPKPKATEPTAKPINIQ